MISEKEFKFYVVKLLERSFTDSDKYVCIPISWIRIRETADGAVLIKYPKKEPSETKEQVKKEEECSDGWEIQFAELKFGTNSYNEANKYIKILNKIYIQKQKSTKVVENDTPSTSGTKIIDPVSSSEANKSYTAPTLSSTDMESMSNQATSGHLELTASQVELCQEKAKADETTQSSLKAKRYFTRQNSKKSSPVKTISSWDQTVENNFQKTSKCVGERSKIINQNLENKLSVESPKMLTDDEVMRAALRKVLGANYKLNLEMLYAEFKRHYIMLQSLYHNSFQHCKTLMILIELSEDDNNNKEVITKYKNMTAINDKTTESHNNDGDKNGTNKHDDKENKNNSPADKIRGQARKFTLPPEYDPGDSKWTLKHREKKRGLVELAPQSHIYVDAIKLSNCKRMSKDSKTLARMLLVEVFSESALCVCSPTGKKTNAFNVKGSRVRPGLDEHARNILLNYVKKYALKQKWVLWDKHTILNSIRNKMQEIRGKSMDRKNSES